MKNILITLLIATLLTASFAGCAKKKDGNDTDPDQLDESQTYDNAVSDNGFRVTGTLTGTATALASGSAASLKVIDNVADDSSGAGDLADFLLDATEGDGTHVQAELRTMTTAKDIGVTGEFFGGVAQNEEINGDTGLGVPDLPETHAWILLQGLARIRQNNETLEGLQLVQVAVTHGIRAADGTMQSEMDHDDLEVHVLFPGNLLAGNDAFPGQPEGFVYYYFENVKLTQLEPTEKSTVGSRLTPPEIPNMPPVATAVVRLNGTQVSNASFDPDTKFLNVTLDASASTDSDGTIDAYSWSVREFNGTGALVDLNKTSGAQAPFSFTSGGAKIIDLRIIDDDGGIANTTIYFFVDTHKTYTFTFGAESPLNGVGGGTSCQEGSNCFAHSLTIFYGAESASFSNFVKVGSGQCSGYHIDVYGPDDELVKSGTGALSLEKSELALVGKYDLEIWWTAQANCGYTFTGDVLYSPQAQA